MRFTQCQGYLVARTGCFLLVRAKTTGPAIAGLIKWRFTMFLERGPDGGEPRRPWAR
jgi:hypothetical protein